jgi:hypothetical protein
VSDPLIYRRLDYRASDRHLQKKRHPFRSKALRLLLHSRMLQEARSLRFALRRHLGRV